MSPIRAAVIGLIVQAAAIAPAIAQSPPLMERQKEIAMALSACPASVADKAAIYVLEKTGYVKIRDSQNGFTAIVQHSMPITQEPECHDAEATRTFIPRRLMLAELRAQGKSPEEIRRSLADALAKGILQPPARAGVIYMLSKENIPPDLANPRGAKPFPPHVMVYAPNLTNADIGASGKDDSAPAFVANEGSPFALIIVAVPTDGSAGHVHPAEGVQ
jgi:hypothetical protein